MGFSDKISKAVSAIKAIEQKMTDLQEKYTSKIEELNDKLQELQEQKDAAVNNAAGKAQKSAQYIKVQVAKIQKEYNDIAKSFNDKIDSMTESVNKLISEKIEGLKMPIAGELGSKLGLPAEAAEAIASPVVSALSSTIQFNAPNIKLPELNLPIDDNTESSEETT